MTIKVNQYFYWELPVYLIALVALFITGSVIMLMWALALAWWLSGDITISWKGAPETEEGKEQEDE